MALTGHTHIFTVRFFGQFNVEVLKPGYIFECWGRAMRVERIEKVGFHTYVVCEELPS